MTRSTRISARWVDGRVPMGLRTEERSVLSIWRRPDSAVRSVRAADHPVGRSLSLEKSLLQLEQAVEQQELTTVLSTGSRLRATGVAGCRFRRCAAAEPVRAVPAPPLWAAHPYRAAIGPAGRAGSAAPDGGAAAPGSRTRAARCAQRPMHPPQGPSRPPHRPDLPAPSPAAPAARPTAPAPARSRRRHPPAILHEAGIPPHRASRRPRRSTDAGPAAPPACDTASPRSTHRTAAAATRLPAPPPPPPPPSRRPDRSTGRASSA